MSEENLKKRTIKGFGWNFLDNILNRGISFVVGIVLARLLSPSEYGLIGIIMIFIAIFSNIVDSGLGSALIRKNDCTEEDYDTVFHSNLFLSIIMSLLFFLCAPLIADFFNEPQLKPLAQVMSCTLIINAFSIIQNTLLLKQLDFKGKMVISMISSLASGAAGIAMAYSGYGVWSLVGQQISRQVLYTTLLWLHNRWIPRLRFSKSSFHELFGFGWKLLVSGLIDTVWREIYQVVIGKFYTLATLGLYSRAHQFSTIFSSNLTSVVQSVSFPALSKVQDDPAKLKRGFRKVNKTSMLISFAMTFGMMAVAEPMVKVLIGDKWLPCVPFLQIICLQMVLYPFHSQNLNLLEIRGRSDLFLKIQIIKKGISVVPIILGIFISIYWMLAGSVFTGLIDLYVNSYYSKSLLDYDLREQLKDIAPSFAITLSMAIFVYMLSFLPLAPLAVLIIQLLAGFSVLILLCETFRLSEYLELKEIVLTGIRKK